MLVEVYYEVGLVVVQSEVGLLVEVQSEVELLVEVQSEIGL